MKHWQLNKEESGIAVAVLDRAGESTNALSAEVMAEFAQILDQLDLYPPKGLIVRSGKAAGFIAGADIGEFSQLDTPEKGRALVARGWDLFKRLAAVKYPTLALVRGHCLGGGLELALACRYLLAVDEPGTKLALPEVMLGIFPGWGGMLRLPQRVGPAAALDLMLTGKSLDAKRARNLGLADECVPPRVMEMAAHKLLLSNRPRRPLSFVQKLLAGPLKAVVANGARKQVAKKARPEHYPAPYAIIDLWQKHEGNALAAPAVVDRIIQSPTAKNLLRVFHLQERLKGFGKPAEGAEPFKPRHVHVVGAGVMGGDIAAVCAQRGMTVTLQDQSVDRIAPAIKRAAKFFERKYKGDKRQVRFALDRMVPDPEGHGIRRADVIIEAIFENLDAKRTLFARIESEAKPDAVIATNTSSLRIEDIATALEQPQRLVGIHFFNPVTMLPLVEVVDAEGTDVQALGRAAEFVRAIEKLPLPVKSAPGFLVNAALGPYMLEALRCVEEGIAPEAVDRALVDFGMPMGPVELVDTVGLDIAVAAGKALTGDAAAEPPAKLMSLVQAGKLGRKSGEGYYRWENGKAVKTAENASAASPQLAERVLAPLLAAVRRCVEQGVVADADLADAGVIFGTGFSPWTGGPTHFQASKGVAPPEPSQAEAPETALQTA